MSVTIGSARIDENGSITGGAAGDQTGKEVSTQAYYRHAKGWLIFRPKDAAVAEKLAQAMQWACDNPDIGYDQAQRNTLWNDVKTKNYDPSKTSKKVETDCSALVRLCCAYAGIVLSDFTTESEPARLRACGAFTEVTDLKRGDILVTGTKGHTAIVLTGGENLLRITGSTVNVRKGNGIRYGILATMNRGAKLPWIATAENNWHAVDLGDAVGWVSEKYSQRLSET